MNKKDRYTYAIILGDHAGIGPEIVAKALAKKKGGYIPVLVGNRKLFDQCCAANGIALNLVDKGPYADPDAVYFVDIPAGPDIAIGKVSRDSGELILNAMLKAIELSKDGTADAVVLAPITKQSLHKWDDSYSSDFDVFARQYGAKSVKAVVKRGDIHRSTVIGHCPFREIHTRISTEGILQTARELLDVMRRFRSKNMKIAVAALNPHAGENGLFGDEEARIIQPAIDQLRADGEDVIGPSPADTVFLKAKSGEVGGVVFLYHDQGNIAMKSSFFGSGIMVYTNVPVPVVSVGHGSALDIAGKGVADSENMELCIGTLAEIFGE